MLVDNAVTVDPENKVTESNEADNTGDVQYFLVDPLPTSTPTPRSGAVGGSVVLDDSTGDAAGKQGTASNGSGRDIAWAVALAGGLLAAVGIGGVRVRRRRSR